MSVIIRGGSGNLAEVSVDNNLSVNTPAASEAGFVTLSAESDPGNGALAVARKVVQLEASDDYRLRTGADQTFFNEYFPGTVLNLNVWSQVNSVMTSAVASGFNTLNSALSVAISSYSNLRTWRHFPVYMSFPTYCEIDLQYTAITNGNVMEWGLGLAALANAPTDGAFFRITSTGEFRAVLSTAGSEQLSADLVSVLPAVNVMKDYLIVLSEKSVEFWISDSLVAVLDRASSAAATTGSMNLPVFIRTYNTAATALANTIKIGYVNVSLGDMATNRKWEHVMAGSGGMAYQQQTGAAALGTTALLTNSLAAGAGIAMTNTTAALGTGLGGQFGALPTLTAGTDGIVCSYLVPAGSATFPGKSLYITGVRVQGAVTTLLAGGPVLYSYSLAYGANVLSLATADSGAVKGPRRIALGYETFVSAAAAGVIGTGVYMAFNSPIVIQPGEYIQLVAKNLGTVTTAGVINFQVAFDGFME